MTIKKIIVLLALFFGFLFFAKTSFAANTLYCNTYANCKTAIEQTAGGGDTVQIAAGQYNATGVIEITKPLTIQGVGKTSTFINANGHCVFWVHELDGGNVRITGMGFSGQGGTEGNPLTASVIRLSGNHYPETFSLQGTYIFDYVRIDNCDFVYSSGRSMVNVGAYWDVQHVIAKVLFDNNTVHQNTNSGQFLYLTGQYPVWTQGELWGTTKAFVVEDSEFWCNNASIGLCGFSDLDFGGGNLIVRRNKIHGGAFAMHDASNGIRGYGAMEIYSNQYFCDAGYTCGWGGSVLGARGGSQLVYNNAVIGDNWSDGFWSSEIYRAGYNSSAVTGRCGDGWKLCTHPLDGFALHDSVTHAYCGWLNGNCVAQCITDDDCPSNDGTGHHSKCVQVDGNGVPGAPGYPCLDQNGRGQDDPITHKNTSMPIYGWGNTYKNSGCPGNACVHGYLFPLNYPNGTAYIEEGRDFCNVNPTWNGTSWLMPACGAKTAWTYTPMGIHPLLSGATQICGNNIKEGNEVCDGSDLVGQTCVSKGFSGGTLSCASNCQSFVTSSCASSYFLPNQYIQAESGSLSGMQIGISGSDTYIYSNTDNTGLASYTFNIAQAGQYKIEARVNSNNDGGQNSFFVGIATESAQSNNYYSYSTPVTSGFIWDEVNRTGNGTILPQYDPMSWNLQIGTHTFTFYGREANTWLDQIRLVGDSGVPAAPTGLAVR